MLPLVFSGDELEAQARAREEAGRVAERRAAGHHDHGVAHPAQRIEGAVGQVDHASDAEDQREAEGKGVEVDMRWVPARGWDVVLGLSLLDTEITDADDIIEGIVWCAQNDIKVANMSLGGAGFSQAETGVWGSNSGANNRSLTLTKPATRRRPSRDRWPSTSTTSGTTSSSTRVRSFCQRRK